MLFFCSSYRFLWEENIYSWRLDLGSLCDSIFKCTSEFRLNILGVKWREVFVAYCIGGRWNCVVNCNALSSTGRTRDRLYGGLGLVSNTLTLPANYPERGGYPWDCLAGNLNKQEMFIIKYLPRGQVVSHHALSHKKY